MVLRSHLLAGCNFGTRVTLRVKAGQAMKQQTSSVTAGAVRRGGLSNSIT